MNRAHLTSGGILLLVFAVIAGYRHWTSETSGETPEPTGGERDRIVRFWQLHREAGAHRIAGEFDRAIRLYEAALELDPVHEDALYYLANAYIEKGRLLDADRTLARLTDAHPANARGRARRGEVHLCFADDRVFDPERAKTLFTQARELNQEETGPLLRLAQAALVQARYDDARHWLEAVASTHASSIEAHYLLGYVAWKEGADGEAFRRLYGRALDLALEKKTNDPVVGEGDRKHGAAIRPGEQGTCPTMLDLLAGVLAWPGSESPDAAHAEAAAALTSSAETAYERVDRALDRLRQLAARR